MVALELVGQRTGVESQRRGGIFALFGALCIETTAKARNKHVELELELDIRPHIIL